MKQYTCLLLLFSFLCANGLVGCYEDKGNYDYTDLGTVTIQFPATSYDVQLGQTLPLTATVETTIDTADLRYEWQIFSDKFQTIAKGIPAEYCFQTNEYIAGPGNYTLRLVVKQESTGREMYSEQLNVRVSGVTGLLVLHGLEGQCDVGLLVAPEFLVNEGSVEVQNTPHWYSEKNNDKIAGEGMQIIHLLTANTISYTPERCYVAVITTEGCTLAGYSDLTYEGEGEKLFYGDIAQGNIERFGVDEYSELAIRGGDFYLCKSVYWDKFYVAPLRSGLPETYELSPFVMSVEDSYPVEYMGFEEKSRSFITWSDDYAGSYYATTLSSPGAVFDLGNMNADLVYWDKGGRTSHMAVMRQDDGSYFLAELNLNTSETDKMPIARYELSTLPDFNQSLFYAFGDNQMNMCYYATASKAYRYSAGNGVLSSAEPLKMMDGSLVNIEGEITMMKILKPCQLEDYGEGSPFSYYNYNKILLVGTYSNGEGRLYVLHLDEMTGLVREMATYEGFDKIYDANIKGI